MEMHHSLVEYEQAPAEKDTDSPCGTNENLKENGTVTVAALENGFAPKTVVTKVDLKETNCLIVETVSFHSDIDDVL